MLIAALITLDIFNQNVLGEGTLNNPVNSLGFAAVGKGPFMSHILRIVSSPPWTCHSLRHSSMQNRGCRLFLISIISMLACKSFVS